MKFDRRAAVADEGVVGVNVIVSKDMRWIFRELAKRDLGVDAQVEVCEGERATSKLLALQIKSGESYFRDRTEAGMIFRDSQEHLEYFLAHSLPLLVVLYDPDTSRAWWQHVCERNVERTATSWKMVIPFDQEVGQAAVEPWREISVLRPAHKSSALPKLKPWYASEAGLAEIFEVLHGARRTLDVTSPYVSAEFVAILEFLATKVHVRAVVGDNETSTRAASSLSSTARLSIRYFPDDPGRFHEKLVIVDRRALCVGSANLTWPAQKLNLEVLHYMTDKRSVRAGIASFDALWSRARPQLSQTTPPVSERCS